MIRKVPLPPRKKPIARSQKPLKRTALKRTVTRPDIHQPTKANKIKRRSTKRQEQEELYYSTTLPAYLHDHPVCEICGKILAFREAGNVPAEFEITWWPACSTKSTEVHHDQGRTGAWLNKVATFHASCDSRGGKRNGHTWIGEFPAAAKFLGLIKTRSLSRSAY